jgi:hypothetical protein
MFGVIYSKATGRIRSHTGTGHTSSEIDSILKVGTGEALFKFNDNQFGDLPTLQSLLSQSTGLTPSNDRYAIVDTSIISLSILNSVGNVVGSIIADPSCGDNIPGYELIAHSDATKGWKYTSLTGFVDIRPVAIKVGS